MIDVVKPIVNLLFVIQPISADIRDALLLGLPHYMNEYMFNAAFDHH